jgi:PIN domain nuclease of toxin-antitoxin system
VASLVLLDTHVIVWLITGDKRLGRETRMLLDKSITTGIAAISAISVYEFSWIISRRQISLGVSADTALDRLTHSGIQTLDMSGAIARLGAEMPLTHGDPIDRIIAATALTLDALLLTADEKLLAAELSVSMHDARL